jgi:aminopeptidase N
VAALRAFYADHVGQAATMEALLETIELTSGFDATTCAEAWLRSDTVPSSDGC